MPRKPGTVDDRNKRPANADRLFQHAAEIMATQPVPPELDRDPNLPSWLDREMSWCCGAHAEDDVLVDRDHVVNAPNAVDGDGGVPLSLYDPAADGCPGRLTVEMRQGTAEVSPRIIVNLFTSSRKVLPWLTMTTDEAVKVAYYLTSLAEMGEQALPTADAEGGPFWLTTECPRWCDREHVGPVMYGDRNHFLGETFKVPLLLARSTGDEPEGVELDLRQHYRSTEAVIQIMGPNLSGGADLSTFEVRALAAHLLDLVEMAEGEA